jgi:murein L,D-transpeptidase YcbB/YkuD
MKTLFQPNLLFSLIFVLSFSVGCSNSSSHSIPAKSVVADTVIKGNFTASSGIILDSLSIDSFIKAKPLFSPFTADFRKFYRLRNYNFAWYDRKGITEATSNLINHLNTQQSDGILKKFPYREEFNKLINQLQNGEQQKPQGATELMLTAQYFNYAKNSWGGSESNKTADIGWYLPKKKLTYADLLQHQLTEPVDSVEQRAVIPQYITLKKALHTYQEIEKKEKDIFIPNTAKLRALKPGDTSETLIPIRKRLYQLGDLEQPSESNLYDDKLLDAIKHFKDRHGITQDSRLSPSFLKQINVPIHVRIEQMMINMERLRWIPVDDHGGEYILINIPEYKLHYFVDNQLEWNCKVVVGKVMNQTVIFSGHLEYIVFSPYWYIPQSIISTEIKPAMARNPGYLAEHRMEWNGGNVRQKPGPENSLGLVKFIFPNSNNIYLHDTPAKPLFAEDSRAFSHGCVRVSEPKALALRLLKDQPSWTLTKVNAAMHRGVEQTVYLKKKIPVYIGYFTAFVNSKGVLNFRDDVYKRDPALLNLLMKD